MFPVKQVATFEFKVKQVAAKIHHLSSNKVGSAVGNKFKKYNRQNIAMPKKKTQQAVRPPPHELPCPQQLQIGLTQTEIFSTVEQPEKDLFASLIIRLFQLVFFSRNNIFLSQQISQNSVSSCFFSEANGHSGQLFIINTWPT